MKIEDIRLKNFKVFQKTEIKDLPNFCVFVGVNGSGKSTLFSVFSFLQDMMKGNVNTALAKHGGSRGFQEFRSRQSEGPIEIELKFRSENFGNKKATYQLHVNEKKGKSYIEKEILQYRRGSRGQPWQFLNFSNGEGEAVTNELEQIKDESQLQREKQKLKSNDILAIKGLSQFEKFPAVMALGDLIENFHISDFHMSQAREEQQTKFSEHLSREGENLSLVVQYLYKDHPQTFQTIINKLKERIPGISKVEAKTTEEGRVLLKFKDGSFQDPFLARYISDGTIKMLAYLVLLYDPKPHPILCVEEPENQLYPKLLEELAEEFRFYANRGGQVFVSTHSPDFLNAVQLEEVFFLEKKEGKTQFKCAKDNEQVAEYMRQGDKMGYLWKQGFFKGIELK